MAETARGPADARWRLVLGGGGRPTGSLGSGAPGRALALTGRPTRDAALRGAVRRRAAGGGLGGSAPRVARWLGDIRGYFPSTVVQVMQPDAIERLGLRQLLLEPEMLRGGRAGRRTWSARCSRSTG